MFTSITCLSERHDERLDMILGKTKNDEFQEDFII